MDERVYEWVGSVSGIVVDGERKVLKEWWFRRGRECNTAGDIKVKK